MRGDDPVYWSDGLGAWMLTRYNDVLAALRHPSLSSMTAGASLAAKLRGGDPAVVADHTRVTAGMMIMKDGEDHRRLRGSGNHAFGPAALARWTSTIERVVNELLDAAMPSGRMDLIDDLARPLPAIVIAELFGIPPEDRGAFHEWSMTGARFFGIAVGDTEEAARAANEAAVNQEQYFLGLLEERRRRPGDDLMSLLLQGQAGGRLTAEELCSQCILLLGAGHITTMDQLGNTALALLRDPEQIGRLRDKPALTRSATEEGLRYDGAAQLLQRVAREELTLGGKAIGAGELVYVSLGAANRDPGEVRRARPIRRRPCRQPPPGLRRGVARLPGIDARPPRAGDRAGAAGAADAAVAPRRGAAVAAAGEQPCVPRAGFAAGSL